VPLSRFFPEAVQAGLARYARQGEISQLLRGSGFEQGARVIRRECVAGNNHKIILPCI
jgi:hypothetical protein